MLSKILGALIKLIYMARFGKRVSLEGVPSFISHMKIYVKLGRVTIGKNFTMKQGVYLAAVNGGEITIGDNVYINRNCMLVCHEVISIGDNCSIAPNVVLYDHDHNYGYNGIESGFKTAPIIIEKNCWIGAGATILRGTHIGEGSVIGAGTVVYGEIPAHSRVLANRELQISPIIAKR